MTDSTLPDDGTDSDGDDAVDFAALTALLHDEAVWAVAPPGLEDSIVAVIGAEGEIAAVSADEARSEAADGEGGDGGEVIDLEGRRRRHRWYAVAAAAALVLIAGLGVLFTSSGDDDGPQFELALEGTDLAPDASAVAAIDTTPDGVRIILDITGLPPAPEGSFYQAWVRNDSEGVAAGTFHVRGGDGSIELWSGVAIEDYPLVTVTIQEEGAGPESSGQVVLRGRVER